MKSILAQVKQYKRDSILTPIFTALEVLMEVLLPYVTAMIIDQGIQQSDFNKVLLYGGLMLVMAGLSLTFGALAGKYGASASSGLACNLRQAIYDNIQRFSFSNIDKFSTAGLITRMTTDVTNVQNAYQMCLRIAVRAPLMLVSSMVMSFIISPRLSSMFLIAIFFLAVVLGLIMIFATKVFNVMFKKYDALNASIQENVSAIRVVKAYVREEHEDEKFKKASGDIYNLSVKAESLLAFNGPVMMLVIYSCIILIAWVGAQLIVGGEMSTGNLTSLFSYVMSIMMSLMMLSMIIVMITMSLASIRRISEVLDEKSDLHNPENPIEVVADGSIDFDNVDFAYKHGSGNNTLSDINLHIRAARPSASSAARAAARRAWSTSSAACTTSAPGPCAWADTTCASTIWKPCATRSPSCCRRTSCSPARSWTTCAGATRTPRRRSASRPAARPARTSSSSASRISTTPGSSRAAPTSPAARSSASASPARC